MVRKTGYQITCPFPNFKGCTFEFSEWISNFIPHIIIDIIKVFIQIVRTGYLCISAYISIAMCSAVRKKYSLGLNVQWNTTGKRIVGRKCVSVCFQRYSSGLPECFDYANHHWIATGTPLGDNMNQCGSSGFPAQIVLTNSGLPLEWLLGDSMSQCGSRGIESIKTTSMETVSAEVLEK